MLLKLIKGLTFMLHYNILLIILLILLNGCESTDHNVVKQAQPSFIRYPVKSYKQTMQILDNLGYTQENFKKGMKKIPKVLITHISIRWGRDAQKIPVSTKKSIFLRLMASEALIANNEVEKERDKLLSIVNKIGNSPITHEESGWLKKLAKKYKVIKSESDILSREEIDELIKRVDIIPLSLIVAQGAIESGWGTSRFAYEGNALFGQWSFNPKNALKPKNQRGHLGNYGIKKFDTPLDSIRDYILNLNTHLAYKKLRVHRAMLREDNLPLVGVELAYTLKSYSEKGDKYVKDIIRLIEKNNLRWLDHAQLSSEKPVIIHPED